MGGYAWISLTTDFGTSDGFVAACHGAIARVAPQVRVIDVTHQVPPGEVARGATVLAQTVAYLPESVHVAVVDPGVGTERRGIVISTPGGLLVGPDNGLLMWAATALGGVDLVVQLSNQAWFAPAVSRTFHGRDDFAPTAARLAAGAPVTDAGPALDPATLTRLPDPVVTTGDGWIQAEVTAIDRFGNVQLAAPGRLLAGLGTHLQVGGVRAQRGDTFGAVPPGGVVIYVNSADRVEIAVNRGRAAVVLSVVPGDVLRISERHRAQ
ncbi:MAG TPA: SAM-dependent chlorinase/fluorinase [Actinoplanes sp.]|nr:SAM-dependent chlorinase/fluorinase [Actinoplanes sp.]